MAERNCAIKMKNADLINIMAVLQQYGNKKLPQKISYAITRNMMIVTKEYQVYERQLRKIFDDYAEYMVKDDDGKVRMNDNLIPVVDESVREEFNQQISDLLNIEIDVDIYHIDFDVFDYADSERYDAMSAQDIMSLQFILCERTE